VSTLLASVYDGRGYAPPALIAIDTDSGQARQLPLDLPPGITRCMGLCLGGSLVYLLAAADDRSALLALDPSSLRQLSCAELAGVRDGHSVVARGESMYVVSSGTDEVVSFRMRDHAPGESAVAWAASDTGRDTCHLNDIAWHRDRLLVAAFGTGPREHRNGSPGGRIYDVSERRTIASGLMQPHSITERGGRLYYCESAGGRLRTGSKTIVTLPGYLRGAAWLSDEVVCLGTSEGRPPSGAPYARSDDCAVWFVDVTSQSPFRRIPLSKFGPEIYSVLHLPGT
jgi:hypothetical protein